MRCIEPGHAGSLSNPQAGIDRRTAWLAVALSAAGLAGCAVPMARAPAPAPAPAPAARSAPPQVAARPAPSRTRHRNWDEYRKAAAQRMVEVNPSGTYMGEVIQPLLAIPVLDVELNGDGSVRNISVMRRPSQAHDTIKLAMDAVQRAAPYGDVTHLPKPWRFTETFLFNDDRRFKPMTLDR